MYNTCCSHNSKQAINTELSLTENNTDATCFKIRQTRQRIVIIRVVPHSSGLGNASVSQNGKGEKKKHKAGIASE